MGGVWQGQDARAHRQAAVVTTQPVIDKEIARCRLLCINCSKVETDARADAPGPSEERVCV